MPSDGLAEKIVAAEVARAGVAPSNPTARFPVIVRGGTLRNGHAVRYVLNYSATPQAVITPWAGVELLHGQTVASGARLALAPWDVAIIEKDGRSN